MSDTTTSSRIEKIRTVLEENFAPEHLEIIDESHLHAGHKSAGGLGHFQVIIGAKSLANLSMVKAHQAVYKAMDELLKTDVHALSIKLKK